MQPIISATPKVTYQQWESYGSMTRQRLVLVGKDNDDRTSMASLAFSTLDEESVGRSM